uniref:DUF674 family protein n=1 Tax=Zea mays TaxID=4577 RepID=A0A804MHJ1_MAIZE
MASMTAATDVKPAPAASGPQLKLLVDRRSQRVLYAEARKDAVDFLIGLLRVPAGLAARALAKCGQERRVRYGECNMFCSLPYLDFGLCSATERGQPAPGSLGSLHAGALALDDAFFVSSSPNRDALLSTSTLPSAALSLLLGEGAVPPAPAPPPPQRFFRCNTYTLSPCTG